MTGPVLAAWSVHLYTAFGAVLGFLALEATARSRYGLAFIWLAVATVIDSTDGTLARRMRVKQLLPHFDGARLDDIVDYLNYVVVPMVLAYHAALVPRGLVGLAIATLPLLASGYGFCQIDAKTDDHFFKGFPSYWNVVVFYFYTLRSASWFNVTMLVLFSVLVFVPIRYLYPSRTPTARRTTHVLGILWAVCLVVLLLQFPTPSRRLAQLSLFFPVYYLALSFHLHFRDR
ncbi:MAG: CDP-alcohol phosphatidyltransferase family protein, partial [Candidatus Binatia bacterium]